MGADAAVRHAFVTAGELRFHVAYQGEGDRLALCLHGFPECWYSWRHQLPVLAGLGYRAWAPDLRGYGRSDRPPRMRDYALDLLVDDIARLIDASGARETVLLGHDWGGLIAWSFAARRIRPLAGLVILNCPHPAVATDPRARALRQRLRFGYALFFQLPWLPERLLSLGHCRAIGSAMRRSSSDPSRFPDEVLAVYRDEASRPGALKAMIDYYRAYGRGGGARRERMRDSPPIETPTLLLWGEDDPVLGRDLALASQRFAVDLTLRWLPGVSHWTQQDAPEQVNAMLSAWLRGATVPEAVP